MDLPDSVRQKLKEHDRLRVLIDRSDRISDVHRAAIDRHFDSLIRTARETSSLAKLQHEDALSTTTSHLAELQRVLYGPAEILRRSIDLERGRHANILSEVKRNVAELERVLYPRWMETPGWDAITRAERSISETLQAAYALRPPFEDGYDSLKRTYEQLARIEPSLRAEREFASARATSFASHLPTFAGSFIARLEARLQTLERQDAEIGIVADEVRTELRTKLPAPASSWVAYLSSPQFLCTVLLLFLQVYWQKWYTDEQAQDQRKQMDELIAVVRQIHNDEITRLQSSLPKAPAENLFVVTRLAKVRAERRRPAAVIAIVYPNQIVQVEKVSKEWVYIEYLDNLEGVTRTGWTYKKYLDRTNRK